MQELRKNLMNTVTNIIKEYEEVIKEAEKSGEGINLIGIHGKCQSHIEKLDSFFSEFTERSKKKKKRWFG